MEPGWTILGLEVLELIAVVFGIASVYLSVRENIWSWPTALVNVTLYFLIFRRQQLYALMGLQVFYAAISVYGWYHWLFGGEGGSRLHVTLTPRRFRIALPLLAVAGIGVVGVTLDRTTDAARPLLDSSLAVCSLIAQWMMSRKYLENWLLWIGVNIVSVGLFLSQGMYPTAFLYTVFFGLASKGYVDWRRSWRAGTGTPGEPHPPESGSTG